MKRHPSLAPFSREHHGALILAQLLKKDAPDYKGLPQLPSEKVEYAFRFYQHDLLQHFEKEETMLDRVEQYHPEIEKLSEEIRAEHSYLKTLFESLQNEMDIQASMHVVGTTLEAHIRKEERILFPLIQTHCPASILDNMEW